MTELGSRLKEARLQKGMSLDELQTVTKIQKRYLIGIEEGNYRIMPGKFYVRAFIKQYAEAVGLNHEELLDEYKSEIPATTNEDIPEKLSRVQTSKNISPSTSKLLDVLPKVLIIVFIIGVLAVIYYFVENSASDSDKQLNEDNNNPGAIVENNMPKDEKQNEDAAPEEDKEDAPDEKAEEEKPVQEISVQESSGKNTVYELKNTDTFILTLSAEGKSWVRVASATNETFYEETMEEGVEKELDLTDQKEVQVIIGNTTATEIKINDKKLEYEVSPSEYVNQNITIRFTSLGE
ncbi:helix-turn-helix domain-containing protein [Cytobacillus sp. Sa5YUA1]|uniref:Helix-turn-helix domain-containing protein n=1 Tax=Cytobacillus stercorigallinarum TaxID=2762240 RepID=A0ABR8QMB3_9BACI|nr:helix-turn-helix domain-containing protein [Cytobacillus stercorigallinarum]